MFAGDGRHREPRSPANPAVNSLGFGKRGILDIGEEGE
jgi:hypothetical protein